MISKAGNTLSRGLPARALALALMLAMPAAYASDIVYCSVDYEIVDDWGAGFQVNIVVTNDDSSPIEGYTLEWNMVETLIDGWNATFSQSGGTVTASNPADHWNGTIQPDGGTVAFGFQGSNSSPPAEVPDVFTLNGIECNPDGNTGSSSSSSSSSSTSSSTSSTSSSTSSSSSSSSSNSSTSSSSSSSSSYNSSGGSVYGLVIDEYACATTTAQYVSDEPDYNGSGYLDVDAANGARVDFPGVGTSGGPITSETLTIRYANGTNVDLPMAVYADGDYVKELTFSPTGAWSNWERVTAISDDRIGYSDRQVSLVATSENGGPHIDSAVYAFSLDFSGSWGWSSPFTKECPVEPLPGTGDGGNREPVADFISPSGYNGYTDQPVEFDASESRDPNGDTLTYSWDFDDGTTASGVTTSHTFGAGVYTVALTVDDGNGGQDVVYRLIKIQDDNSPSTRPTLDVSVETDHGFAPLTLEFDASGSTDPDGDVLDFSWVVSQLRLVADGPEQTYTFQDLAVDGPVQTFTFDEPGTYSVSMAADDNNGRYAGYSERIVVRDPADPACKLEITPSPLSANYYNLDLYLTNRGETDINGWEVWWEFPPEDGPTSLSNAGGLEVAGNNPYIARPRHESVEVVPAGDWIKLPFSGSIDFESGIREPEVKGTLCDNTEPPPPANQPPVARISASPSSGPAPLTVEFDATASSDPDGDPLDYFWWDFGDGNTRRTTSRIVSHTYSEAGEYTATVTVDDGDLESTASAAIRVTEPGSDLSCSVGGLDVWTGGFVANIIVQNNGSSTANGYDGVVTFSHPVSVNNGWNVSILPPGEPTEVPFSVAGTLQSGQSASFGFMGAHSAGNALQIVDCSVAPGPN